MGIEGGWRSVDDVDNGGRGCALTVDGASRRPDRLARTGPPARTVLVAACIHDGRRCVGCALAVHHTYVGACERAWCCWSRPRYIPSCSPSSLESPLCGHGRASRVRALFVQPQRRGIVSIGVRHDSSLHGIVACATPSTYAIALSRWYSTYLPSPLTLPPMLQHLGFSLCQGRSRVLRYCFCRTSFSYHASPRHLPTDI